MDGDEQEKAFSDRYGPWAVIAGASEGTGRAFARCVASRGVNCLLFARRQPPAARRARVLAIDAATRDIFNRN